MTIEVNNLCKSFRIHQKSAGLKASARALFVRKWVEKQALRNISLRADKGEIVGLVGANGAGKTTLVKILSGLVHPDSGSARILGFDPWERKNEFRRQISLIMGQKAQLWWDLPAADCFLLLREIYEIDHAEFKKRLDELSSTLGVERLLTTQVRRLSLGERMKMELIAALLHRPQVIFLDEPTIGLDISAQKALRTFIADYVVRFKPTIILTSHYMEDIETLCKRLVMIREGEVVFDGQTSEIASRVSARREIVITTSSIVSESQVAALRIPQGCEIRLSAPDVVSAQVNRDQVSEFLTQVLPALPVLDVRMEEADIGSAIEKMMKQGVA